MSVISRREMVAAAAACVVGVGAARAHEPVRKTLTFVRRAPELSHDAFFPLWLAQCEARVSADPRCLGMVVHDVTAGAPHPLIPSGGELEIDAMVEAWTQGAPPVVDSDLIDGSTTFAVEPVEAVRPERGDVCLIAVLRRKPDVTHDQFVHDWVNVHGTLARNVPRVRGLILNDVRSVSGSLSAAFGDVDGVAQSYREDPTRPLDSPQARAWYADGAALIGQSRTYRSREHVLRPYEPGFSAGASTH